MPKLTPLPTMTEPRKAVFAFRFATRNGGNVAPAKAYTTASPSGRSKRRHALQPAVVKENDGKNEDHDDERRRGQVLHQGRQLLDADGDVARVAEAHARRVPFQAAEITDVPLHPLEERAALVLSRAEFRRLDEQKGQVLVRARKPIMFQFDSVADSAAVLRLEIVEIGRAGRRGVVVEEIVAHLAHDGGVAALLDASRSDVRSATST